MQFHEPRSRATLGALALCALAAPALAQAPAAKATDKIPITTSSEEARKLYLQGRDLAEKLRITDSRQLYEQALAKDQGFALAQVGLANTAPSAKEFWGAVGKAKVLASKVSEPERLLITSLEAGGNGEVAKQKDALLKLTRDYPNDERGHNLLGGFYFGQQDYDASIAEYKKATTINPAFSQPYNQLGYAYRFQGKYPEAEQAFKKYVELIPGDPNPYDSYAEFLMKVGRHDASIKSYEKALEIDKNFVASYIGIGNNQMFQGKGEAARQTFNRLSLVARNSGEKRLACFWRAQSFVHEGATDRALDEVKHMATIAENEKDLAGLAGDYNLMGDILLEAGRVDEAAPLYAKQLETIDKADVPAAVKETAHRNGLFDQARVALAKKDMGAAKAKADEYEKQVTARAIPVELRQQHELRGRIALEEKSYKAAAAELEKAGTQDPRVFYLLGLALKGDGDAVKAKAALTKAASWNALSPNYAYVRTKAKEQAGS
jgi:tetratricopeptide (TPR) repeat protein